MGIFIFMYFALAVIGILSTQVKNKRKFICICSFLVLWLIQALRSLQTGTDLEAYIPYFLQLDVQSLGDLHIDLISFEPGYQIYNQLVHIVTNDPNIFLAVTSFLILAPVTFIFYKYSENPFLSFVIFASFIIYHFSFSGLRQALAVGLTYLSYKFVVERKPIVFIGIVLLASTMHLSAIVFFIVYPVCNKLNMTKIKITMLFVLGTFFLLFLKPVVIWLSLLVFGPEKYMGHFSEDVGPSYNLLILLTLIFIVTLAFSKPKPMLNYASLLFLAVYCQALGLISSSASRLAYYFFVFIPLAIPAVINEGNFSTSTRRLLNWGISVFMIFFFFYANSSGYLDVIPYSFYWE